MVCLPFASSALSAYGFEIQFTCYLLAELQICIGIHAGFYDPVMELSDIKMCKDLYWAYK